MAKRHQLGLLITAVVALASGAHWALGQSAARPKIQLAFDCRPSTALQPDNRGLLVYELSAGTVMLPPRAVASSTSWGALFRCDVHNPGSAELSGLRIEPRLDYSESPIDALPLPRRRSLASLSYRIHLDELPGAGTASFLVSSRCNDVWAAATSFRVSDGTYRPPGEDSLTLGLGPVSKTGLIFPPSTAQGSESCLAALIDKRALPAGGLPVR